MSMRRQLKAERQRLLADTTADTINQLTENLPQRIQTVENIDKLIALNSTSLLPVSAAIAALICISVPGLAWIWPKADNKLLVEANTKSVSFVAAQRWHWNDFPLLRHQVVLRNFSSIELPSESDLPPISITDRAWLEMSGEKVRLQELAVEPGANIRVYQGEDGQVTVTVTQAEVSGQLSIEGKVTGAGGSEHPEQDYNFSVQRPTSESLVFRSAPASPLPAIFRFKPSERTILSGMTVNSLSFAHEITKGLGETQFVCLLQSGNVSFPDIAKQSLLKKRDCLSLEGFSGRLSNLTIDNGISVQLEGTADQIQIGPEGFQRKETPSWLEWIFHNEHLAFLWGAIGFLWGTLWSMRKILLSRF